jgi:hypothetical protein
MEKLNFTTEQKCTILNLDTGMEVEALFNPSELSISKSVPWSPHDESKGDNPTLEFTKAEPMELDVELLFDTYEIKENVYELYVKPLASFTLVMEDEKRPPMCRFAWGDQFPEFVGVITSLTTKYTMFLRNGKPVRATCSIKMKQAEKVTLKAEQGPRTNPSDEQRRQSASGTMVQQGDERRADRHGPNHRRTLEENGSEDGTLTPGQQVTRG